MVVLHGGVLGLEAIITPNLQLPYHMSLLLLQATCRVSSKELVKRCVMGIDPADSSEGLVQERKAAGVEEGEGEEEEVAQQGGEASEVGEVMEAATMLDQEDSSRRASARTHGRSCCKLRRSERKLSLVDIESKETPRQESREGTRPHTTPPSNQVRSVLRTNTCMHYDGSQEVEYCWLWRLLVEGRRRKDDASSNGKF